MLSTAQNPSPIAPEATAQDELRSATRYPAAAVPAITGLRISPHGVEATLVNISESGVLAECGERLKPGSPVTVVFEGSFVPRSMEGRVARNSVSSMGRDGRLRYHVGIAFARTIDLGIAPPPPPEPTPQTPEPEPAAASAVVTPPTQIPDTASTPVAVTGAPPAPPDTSIEFEVALPAVDEIVRNRW
jgi:hypothetical protein